MEAIFKTWSTSRQLILKFFEAYSLEQLNKVPEGFSNNLIWNIGHIIVAQQSLIYRGSNQDIKIPARLVDLYKPGTRPTDSLTQEDVDELKALLLDTIDITRTDFERGLFTSYNERTTITGFHLGSVKDAFEFNNYHEGMHLGYMMCIRRFV